MKIRFRNTWTNIITEKYNKHLWLSSEVDVMKEKLKTLQENYSKVMYEHFERCLGLAAITQNNVKKILTEKKKSLAVAVKRGRG